MSPSRTTLPTLATPPSSSSGTRPVSHAFQHIMEPMRRLVTAVIIVLAACNSSSSAEPRTPSLPAIDVAGFEQLLTELDRPAVVNVWASWCLPCRDEAPLFRAAHEQYGEQIAFIGIDYQDSQLGARRFLDEFDLPFPHYFDQEGLIPAELGGIGVPRTYFIAAGGEVMATHNGVIDEETLALQIGLLLNP